MTDGDMAWSILYQIGCSRWDQNSTFIRLSVRTCFVPYDFSFTGAWTSFFHLMVNYVNTDSRTAFCVTKQASPRLYTMLLFRFSMNLNGRVIKVRKMCTVHFRVC